MNIFYQKGISSLFSVLVLAVILTIVFGLSGLIVTQLRLIRNMSNSVIAFYAADAGVEPVIEVIVSGMTPEATYSVSDLGNGASYEVRVFCCNPGSPKCYLASCPPPLTQDADCEAPRYCIKSVGVYPASSLEPSKKMIEVEI